MESVAKMKCAHIANLNARRAQKRNYANIYSIKYISLLLNRYLFQAVIVMILFGGSTAGQGDRGGF